MLVVDDEQLAAEGLAALLCRSGYETHVAISGAHAVEDVQRGRDAGFHAHLVKPVSYDALRATLAGPRAGRTEDPQGHYAGAPVL